LLDACVLYPAPLRDLLLELSAAGLFRARWTNAIHDEWMTALLKRRPELDPQKLERTRELMNAAIPDCLVEGYEGLIHGLNLPDPKDRHVLAAAIQSQSDAIVTFNLRHFPNDIAHRHDVEVLHPDEFVHHQFGLSLPAVLAAVRNCRGRLKNPPLNAEQYLDVLKAQSLLRTATELTRYRAIL
jgi:predicted nucleic acid-binding protein